MSDSIAEEAHQTENNITVMTLQEVSPGSQFVHTPVSLQDFKMPQGNSKPCAQN